MHEWTAQGRRLGQIGRGVGWWIGDWLRYGHERFGERYPLAARVTGLDTQTLMNLCWVASRFEPHRRRQELSFSHHAELAALPDEEQDRWLALAIDERMSVRCLREALRGARRAAEQSPLGEERSSPPRLPSVTCPSCGCRFASADDHELVALNGAGRG